MTQQLAMDRTHSRRSFFAAVVELVGITSIPRPRPTTSPAPFDPELRLNAPFALLNAGPR